MTILRLASLRSIRLSAMTLSALMFLPVAATTGCGGSGGQSTKVQMPDKPTPLPAEGDRIEYGRTAIPEGRSIEAR